MIRPYPAPEVVGGGVTRNRPDLSDVRHKWAFPAGNGRNPANFP